MFQSKQCKVCNPQGCCRPRWTWAWVCWKKYKVSPCVMHISVGEETSGRILVQRKKMVTSGFGVFPMGLKKGCLGFIMISLCFPLWSFIQDLDLHLLNVPGYLAMHHLPPVLLWYTDASPSTCKLVVCESDNSWKCRRLPSCDLFHWFA